VASAVAAIAVVTVAIIAVLVIQLEPAVTAGAGQAFQRQGIAIRRADEGRPFDAQGLLRT